MNMSNVQPPSILCDVGVAQGRILLLNANAVVGRVLALEDVEGGVWGGSADCEGELSSDSVGEGGEGAEKQQVG